MVEALLLMKSNLLATGEAGAGRLRERQTAMPEGSIRAERGADAKTTTPAAAPPKRRRWLRPVLMIGGVLAVVAGAGAFWLHGGRYAGTDDAYVQADKLLLSTDVAGIVQDDRGA